MQKKHLEQLFREHRACLHCPSREEAVLFFRELIGFLFPDFSPQEYLDISHLRLHLEQIHSLLCRLCGEERNTDVSEFMSQLWHIKLALEEDATAMFEGDPAAQSPQEVIRSYPGFYAIAAYRIAHGLLGISRVLPRMITEHAHSVTGIDIHPEATIGKHLCIDHGTGVVIGATTIIGDRVKIYQGVTLGALSVAKRDAHIKRHPTIEDSVIIYAGATILGGNTVVGKNSIIGGNVWLTSSVPSDSKIYYQAKMANASDSTEETTDLYIFKNK